MVDFEALNQWVTFFIGVAVAILTAYATMKNQGLILFPSKKIEEGRAKIKDGLEKIDALTANCAIVQDVKAVAGNISASEWGVIFTFAADRANQPGGYTIKDAEDVGRMIIEAAKTKDDVSKGGN
jgi:hypothetical protein